MITPPNIISCDLSHHHHNATPAKVGDEVDRAHILGAINLREYEIHEGSLGHEHSNRPS